MSHASRVVFVFELLSFSAKSIDHHRRDNTGPLPSAPGQPAVHHNHFPYSPHPLAMPLIATLAIEAIYDLGFIHQTIGASSTLLHWYALTSDHGRRSLLFCRCASITDPPCLGAPCNIGDCGSKLIHSRVVQAGTLNVVGCILESWVVSNGLALGPSSSATGMLRETRKQRTGREQAHAKMHAR